MNTSQPDRAVPSPASTDAVVAARGLTKQYGRHRAVDGIDLTIRRGEVVGLLGPNGAGKTTMLRMLLGLVRPTAGSASVLGAPAGAPKALSRIGSMVEGPAFYPYLSGRDNLRLIARLAGVPRSRIDDALRTVDLADRGRDRFASYSLGMKQRLGVAAALLKDPELVVLDEPTNGLDPAGMRDMRALVVELGHQGRTVVLSSHLMSEVQEICRRVVIIADGRVVAESSVEELRGGTELVVVVEQQDAAARVVAGLDVVTHHTPGTRPGELRLRTPAQHTPVVVRALVDAGVDVLEVRRDERQLEEAFFELTATPPGGQS